MTSYEVVFRCNDISNLVDEDFETTKSLGIKTIIDFRNEEVRGKYPDRVSMFPDAIHLGMTVNGGGRIPVDEKDMFDSYFEMIDDIPSSSAIVRTMIQCEKPMLIHCSAGKDRTGVFSALLLLAAGVDVIDVNWDYMSSLPLLQHARDITLQRIPDFPRDVLYPRADYFPEFIDAFNKKYGDIEGYLSYLGLSELEIKAFANILGVQERSYGAVLFKENKVLLEHMKNGHWSMPKGHVENCDKDKIATVHREIYEELLISPEDYEIVGDNWHQIVYSPSDGHIKRVGFTVAKMLKEKLPVVDNNEVTEAVFIDADEALDKLTYQSDKEVLRWAKNVI